MTNTHLVELSFTRKGYIYLKGSYKVEGRRKVVMSDRFKLRSRHQKRAAPHEPWDISEKNRPNLGGKN